jgi:hypothetical protein
MTGLMKFSWLSAGEPRGCLLHLTRKDWMPGCHDVHPVQ